MSTSRFRRLLRGQGGFSLVDTITGLGMLGVTGVVFATALLTANNSSDLLDKRVEASALVRTQLERILTEPYQSSYAVSVTPPPGFTIYITTQQIDTGDTLQKVSVQVSREGRPMMKVSVYKYR